VSEIFQNRCPKKIRITVRIHQNVHQNHVTDYLSFDYSGNKLLKVTDSISQNIGYFTNCENKVAGVNPPEYQRLFNSISLLIAISDFIIYKKGLFYLFL